MVVSHERSLQYSLVFRPLFRPFNYKDKPPTASPKLGYSSMILGQLDGSLFLKHLVGSKKSTPNGSRRDLRVRGVCIPFLVSLNKWMDTASFLVLALYCDVLHCASTILTHFCTLIHVMFSPGKIDALQKQLDDFCAVTTGTTVDD